MLHFWSEPWSASLAHGVWCYSLRGRSMSDRLTGPGYSRFMFHTLDLVSRLLKETPVTSSLAPYIALPGTIAEAMKIGRASCRERGQKEEGNGLCNREVREIERA